MVDLPKNGDSGVIFRGVSIILPKYVNVFGLCGQENMARYEKKVRIRTVGQEKRRTLCFF